MNNLNTDISETKTRNISSGKNYVFRAKRREEDTDETFAARKEIGKAKFKESKALMKLNDRELAQTLGHLETTQSLSGEQIDEVIQKTGIESLREGLNDEKWAFNLVVKLLQNPEIKDSLKPLFKQISQNLSDAEKN